MQGLVTLVPFVGVGGLIIGLLIYLNIIRTPVRSPKMQEVADAIYDRGLSFNEIATHLDIWADNLQS